MATINLGAIKFNWKGAYNSGTSYAVDDVVSSGGNSYVCIQAHSNQAVGNATAYWNIMSSKGTDADLLNISSTAQGDIYYNNGSAIARLPKGTAGQVLQMNSGATAPEYGTVSSDFVKLSTVNIGDTATANLDFDNVLTSTYDFYKVIGRMRGTNRPKFRAKDTSNNLLSGSNYFYISGGSQWNSGGSNNTQNNGSNSYNSVPISHWNNYGNDYTKDFVLYIINPQTTIGNEVPTMQFDSWGLATGSEVQHIQGMTFYNTSTKWGGFRLYSDNGSAHSWQVTLYGIKK